MIGGSPGAYAQPSPPAEPPVRDSAAERADDHVALAAGVFGYGVGAGLGALAGTYLATNTLLEVDAYTATSVCPDDARKDTAAGLGIRQFLRSSFYLRGGFKFRDLTVDDCDFFTLPPIDESPIDEKKHVQDIGIDMALGNRWQFGAFTIGADWIGLYVSIATTKAEIVQEDRDTGQEIARYESGVQPDVDFRYGYLQIGVSF